MENVDNSLEGEKITLKKLLNVVNELSFIKRINRIYQYHDEPKFYQYSAAIRVDQNETDGHTRDVWKAGGSSMFSEKLAFLKCLAEAIERYSSMVYKQKDFIYCRFSELKETGVNPLLFAKFSDQQRLDEDFRRFIYDDLTPFTWTSATSLLDGKKSLIPAQLAYLNYKTVTDEERLIDIPISTGTAFGRSESEALLHGFFELVERDSFAITYMNRVPCPKVDLEFINDVRIQYLLDQMRRYRLSVHMMDITTDLAIPTFAAVVINETGIGPAVQVGIKSHLDPIHAMVGAFQESLHTRCWMRYLYENEKEKYEVNDISEINSFEQRGMYWYAPNMIKNLDFWIMQKTTPLKHSVSDTSSKAEKVEHIKQLLISKNYQAYYVDLTPEVIKKTGCRVIKVVSPDLQPHYFNEKYKMTGGKRLRTVPAILGYRGLDKLNKIPHPFL